MEQDPLTHRIIGLAMRVHTALGPGLLERVYETCLCYEFETAGLSYQRQVRVPIRYAGIELDYAFRADLIVNNEVMVELKSIDQILPLHEAQLLTYLRLSDCRIAVLINFNTVSLKNGIRRRTR